MKTIATMAFLCVMALPAVADGKCMVVIHDYR